MMENPIRRLEKGTFDVTQSLCCAENQYLNGIPEYCADATHNSIVTIHSNIIIVKWEEKKMLQ